VAKKTWCVPELNDEFRERMEDVLDQYSRPLDANEPVVCLDEQPYQMVDDARPPEPTLLARLPNKTTNTVAVELVVCS